MASETSPLILKQPQETHSFRPDIVTFGTLLLASAGGTGYQVVCLVTRASLPTGGPIGTGICAVLTVVSAFGLFRAVQHTRVVPLEEVVIVDTSDPFNEIANTIYNLACDLKIAVPETGTEETSMEVSLRLLEAISEKLPQNQTQIQESDNGKVVELKSELAKANALHQAEKKYYEAQLALLEIRLKNISQSTAALPHSSPALQKALEKVQQLKSAGNTPTTSPFGKVGSPFRMSIGMPGSHPATPMRA